MRLVVSQELVRRGLRSMQAFLLVVGLGMLTYCLFVLTDTSLFQRREKAELERLLAGRRAVPPAINPAVPAPLPKPQRAVVTTGLIGRIEISRLGVSAIIMEGTSKATLRRAIGHIPTTAVPGQMGNIGLAGHRDTFFLPLRNIRESDLIALNTPDGDFHYRVVSTKVVSPTNVTVLAPSETEILTLVTCYPFFVVGPAPNRFIVRAERVSIQEALNAQRPTSERDGTTARVPLDSSGELR